MIRRSEERLCEERSSMLGGNGIVRVFPLFFTDEYKGHSRLMAELVLEPGCSVGKHRHMDEEELIYVLSGRASYDDNGTKIMLNAGDAAITGPGERHEIVNPGPKSLRYLAVVLTDVLEVRKGQENETE